MKEIETLKIHVNYLKSRKWQDQHKNSGHLIPSKKISCLPIAFEKKCPFFPLLNSLAMCRQLSSLLPIQHSYECISYLFQGFWYPHKFTMLCCIITLFPRAQNVTSFRKPPEWASALCLFLNSFTFIWQHILFTCWYATFEFFSLIRFVYFCFSSPNYFIR